MILHIFANYIFPIFCTVFIALFIITVAKGIREWMHNNSQPKIAAPAKVVAKRSITRNKSYANNNPMNTSYYSTFEFINNERVELNMSLLEYGMMVEGDVGILTLQGSRYISFE